MRLLFAFLVTMTFAFPVLPVMAAQDSHAGSAHHEGLEEIIDDTYHDLQEHEDAHHADGDHGEVQGLPQLDPSSYISQIFWLAIVFAVMHVVFKFKVIPDLSSVVDRRREQIESDLNAAHTLKEEAEAIHAEYEAALTEARAKSSALYQRVENKIKEKEQEEYAAFQAKAGKDLEETEADIDKATKAAMKDMNPVVVEIASLAAKQIAGVKADKKSATAAVKALDKKKAA